MKTKKILMSIVAFAAIGATLSSCGGDNDRVEGELYVCVYDGGYGTEWIKTLAKKYEEKTGIVVHAESDLTILERMEDQLKNKADYDIYMSHDINWQQYASNGWLESLDDLYSREIEGTGKTFEQRLVSGAKELSRYSGQDGTEHYFKSCYTQGAGGFVYNIDMFEKQGWSVPTTYDELKTLCQTIVDAQIEIPGTRDTVVPFAWSGADRQYYWDYIVFEWWAQLAGLEKIETIKQYKGPTGQNADGYEMYNPSTYYKEFNQAYEMWYNLVAKNKSYSNADAQGANLITAQSAFANGKAAMIPYAQWAKYEIGNSTDIKLPRIAMMKTPKAKADAIDVNYLVGFGDSMIIPNNISDDNKKMAKDFMAYMATYEACATFVDKSNGAFLAFDYSDVDLSGIENNDEYTQSIKAKLTECTNFTLASTSEIAIWTVNGVMPWVYNKYYYATAMANPEENTPEIVGKAMYNSAKSNWSVWLQNAGLK